MPGMPEKRTHDYVRHGTTSLFAAFNTTDGTVISSLHRRHRAVEFRKFLAKIDSQVPGHLDVHLVADNYATHKSPAIVRWLESHPRFHMHFTRPTPPGSTRSNGSSPTSPQTCCNAPTTAASKPSRATSASGSRHERGPQTVHLDQDSRTDPDFPRTTSTTNYWRATRGGVSPHPNPSGAVDPGGTSAYRRPTRSRLPQVTRDLPRTNRPGKCGKDRAMAPIKVMSTPMSRTGRLLTSSTAKKPTLRPASVSGCDHR